MVRCQKAQSLMGSIVVIEPNVFLYRGTELFLCFIIIPTKVFFLDGSKKGFGNGIVIWGTWCGKGLCNPKSFQKLPEFERGILGALIAVKNETGGIAAGFESVPKCLGD